MLQGRGAGPSRGGIGGAPLHRVPVRSGRTEAAEMRTPGNCADERPVPHWLCRLHRDARLSAAGRDHGCDGVVLPLDRSPQFSPERAGTVPFALRPSCRCCRRWPIWSQVLCSPWHALSDSSPCSPPASFPSPRRGSSALPAQPARRCPSSWMPSRRFRARAFPSTPSLWRPQHSPAGSASHCGPGGRE